MQFVKTTAFLIFDWEGCYWRKFITVKKKLTNFLKTLSVSRDQAMMICLELNLSLTEENISKVEEIIRKRNFDKLDDLKQ